MGGDWNATFDCSNVDTNIDVVNMRGIPSLRRSRKIQEMCHEFSLVDPFRALDPNKREYTFIPSAVNDVNRSRIDFFLMSSNLFNHST
jgi:exonuclease III